MHLRAVAVVAALGILAGPGAWADEPGAASRAPSASVTTYLPSGTPLPVSPVTAEWSNVTPGCAGRLKASGSVLTGTTTVVRGAFLSRVFRPRDGRLLSIGVERGGQRIVQPLPEGFRFAFRDRVVGHRWSHWFSLHGRVEPTLPGPYTTSVGVTLVVAKATRAGHQLPREQVQVRLGDRLSSTGVVDDAFDVRIGC